MTSLVTPVAQNCVMVMVAPQAAVEISGTCAPERELATLARECLGMSPSKARALMRVERLGEVCPALRDAFRDGALSWVQAQVLTPLLASDAEGDWREAWVRFASTVTVRRLTEVVERACLWREADPAGFPQRRDDPQSFLAFAPEASQSERQTGERQTCARPTDLLGGLRLEILAPSDHAICTSTTACSARRAAPITRRI